jgi:hypothetical protein
MNMLSCENYTAVDYLLMLLQLLGAGFALLILAGFVQRWVKRLADWLWHGVCRVVLPEGKDQ